MSWCLAIRAVICVAICALPAIAAAQSDAAVVVLYNGGVETVEVFDLSADAERVVRLGTRRIVPAEIGAVRIADIKILPDGSHLLADVGARGAAVSTPTGERFRWVLDETERAREINAVSVASYFAPGEPSLVVTADSTVSNVSIRSVTTDDVVWFDNVQFPSSRGRIPQVAVMPMNRLAIAVNWDTIGVYGIELRDTSEPGAGETILSEPHAEASVDATVVEELDVIRDLMALPTGELLVTTRFAIVVLAADGTLARHIDLGGLAGVSGQLASVRVLPSGHWALATFQPGEWVKPHTNHRIHWFDPETSELLAKSEPLSRAPLRVEPSAGHGGTGTFSFDAGLDQIEQGDPTAISLLRLDVPEAVRVGDQLSVRATLENLGEYSVGLSTVSVRGAVGACMADLVPAYDFAVARSVAFAPESSFTLSAEETIDDRFELGDWCMFVQGVDREGRIHTYGDPISFEIEARGIGSDSTIDVTPLPFGVGRRDSVDVGVADADEPDDEPIVQEGGCCATAARGGRDGSGVLLVLVIGVTLARVPRVSLRHTRG